MSEWVKAKRDRKQEHQRMEKAISPYNYENQKKALATDKKFRVAIGDEINKCRDLTFPMIEAAYLENDMNNAGALEDVMQWLDVFLLELGLPLEWNSEANYRLFSKLIRLDDQLYKDSKKLTLALSKLNDKTLKQKGGSVVNQCATLKQYVTNLLTIFKRRRHSLGG